MERIQFVWLDAEISSEHNKKLSEDIHRINNQTTEIADKDGFERFIGRGLADVRRIILIVSGRLGEIVVPKVHDHENILSIYIYCGYREKHEQWSRPYRKVRFF